MEGIESVERKKIDAVFGQFSLKVNKSKKFHTHFQVYIFFEFLTLYFARHLFSNLFILPRVSPRVHNAKFHLVRSLF